MRTPSLDDANPGTVQPLPSLIHRKRGDSAPGIYGVWYTLPHSDHLYRLMEGNRPKVWKRLSGASNFARRSMAGTPLAAHLGNPDRVYIGTDANPRHSRII